MSARRNPPSRCSPRWFDWVEPSHALFFVEPFVVNFVGVRNSTKLTTKVSTKVSRLLNTEHYSPFRRRQLGDDRIAHRLVRNRNQVPLEGADSRAAQAH